MAVQYAPLFALETQFQAKNGRNLTGGFLRVFYAATDDPADTYSDYNLTRNPDKIVLDDNGRALVICDKSKAYRLEVYDAEGMLLWTEEPVYCSGTGGGGVSITKVISTDGSISVEENVAGSTTTYDIGLAPNDSDEFLEWIKCSEEDCGSTWYPVFQDGTMETESGQGIKVHGGHLYHFTNSFTVDPNGTGIDYDTFRVTMYCGDDVVDERDFDIDSSLNDPVLCEFSRDVVPSEDTYVYFKLTIPSTCEVTGEVQAHRIYSGINAVPDTCATKQFVSANYQPLSGMSSYVPYSAIDGNVDGQVTGINGSSIGATVDTATLTSYFISNTAFTSYSSNVENILINMENNVSDISSTVSGLTGTYLEQSASALFAPSGDYAYNSSLSSKVDQSAFDNCCSSMSSTVSALETSVTAISSNVSGLTGVYLEQSASSLFQPSGDYAYNSALSGKLDTSAFSGVSGNFVQNSAFTSYTASALTAIDNSISSIQSSMSSMSSDVSGKVDQSAMSAWIPYSALDYSGTAISGIGGSSLAGMGGGADYTGIYPVNVDNTARQIAVDSLPLVTDSTMTSYASGDSSVIGVAPGVFFSSLPVSASAGTNSAVYDIQSAKLRSQYNGIDVMPNTVRFWENGFSAVADYSAVKRWDSAASSVSGKLDKTAQVVTATATQLYVGTAYLTSVNGAPVSASRAGQAANASLATSAYYDGTGRLISSLPDRAEVSAIASAYATGGGGVGAYTSPSGTIVVVDNTLEGTNSAALTAASGGYFNALSIATFPDVTLSTTPTRLTYQRLEDTSTGGEFILDFTNPLYGGTLFISGYDSTYNTASASAVLENGPYTASVPQGPIIDQIYAWTDGTWLHAAGLTASAAPQVYTTGVGQLAWHSALTGVSSTVATNSGSWGGGVPASTVSSIASSYAASAVSSKLDSTAFSTVSGNFLTAVPSGYATETYVDSSVSAKQDSSAMSSYVPFSAISADENSAITSINGSSIGGGTQVVTATGSGYPAMFAGISSINGSALIANKLSGNGYMIGSGDQGLYLTGTHGTAYYKANEMIINRTGYGEQVKFNLGSAGAQIYGSATGYRGAFMQMNNDNHTAFFGAASGGDAKIELDGYSAGSASMAGWDSTWNTVSSNSATWGTKPETTETPAGFWDGSAIYQKIVSATMAIGTAVTTTNITTPTSDNAWIDQANSYIIHNGVSWGTNWYLSSNRFMACWLNGKAGSISWRGVDAALTGKTATAYITIKYTK